VPLGLLPLGLVGLYYAQSFGFGPIDALWSVVLLVAGGTVGPVGVLGGSALLACGIGAATLAAAKREAEPPAQEARPVTIRGPVGYAGPGSLGGTESTIRR
jgi:hypothetical protein